MTARTNPGQSDLLEANEAEPRAVETLEIVLELEREIKVRKGVYPHWIAKGKISKANADRRIQILEVMLEDYNARLRREAGPRPGEA